MVKLCKNYPMTVRGIFKDFQARRTALVKALTTESHKLYELCDPDKIELWLIGHPDESWEVLPAIGDKPPAVPDPIGGINIPRPYLSFEDWLFIVAAHSDAWLLSVAFFYAWRIDSTARRKLFDLINNLPTIAEVVQKTHSSTCQSNSEKTHYKCQNGYGKQEYLPCQPAQAREERKQGLEVKNDEEYRDLCGACGKEIISIFFWICCNSCWKAFHGDCIKLTPADIKKNHKCPLCIRGELFDMNNEFAYLYETTEAADKKANNHNLPMLSSGGNSQLEFENTVEAQAVCSNLAQAMEEKQEGLEVTNNPEVHKDILYVDCGNVRPNQFVICCTTCKQWVPNNSVLSVDEIKRYKCRSCIMKKRKILNRPRCGSCGTYIFSEDFRVYCAVCLHSYHDNCVTINQYKCPCCNTEKRSRKRLSCGACDKNITLSQFKVVCIRCKVLYHGRCVKIGPTDYIKSYVCPSCNLKRGYENIS